MAPPHPVPFRFLSPGALPPCRIKLLASRVKSLIGVFIEKREGSLLPSRRREDYVELPISLIGFRDAFQDGGPRAELNIDVHLDN